MTSTEHDLHGHLQTELPRLLSLHGVPGASVAVTWRSHTFEVSAGVINTGTRVPVTPDALFQIQSITKLFTATLVMQLVDEGLVRLDEPVQTYVPGFRTADPAAGAKITVRHLLTHTGGFEGDLWQPTTTGTDALERFVDDLVTQASQHSAPGERFSYCNAGFGTLGRLVEVLRGTTWEQALRTHLAEPLGIHELAFTAGQALAFSTAIGHVSPAPGQPLRPSRAWDLMPLSNPAAGAQFSLSARDLVRLGRLFLLDGRNPSVLTDASTMLMLQPHLQHRQDAPAPVHQGLAWWLPRAGIAEHGGGAPGVASVLRIAPEHDLAAAVLTNADAGGRVARDLLDPLFADLAGIAPPTTVPVPGEGTRVSTPEAFVGRYRNRQNHFEVTQDDDGRLWVTDTPRNETVSMALLAGTTASTARRELRPLNGDAFAVIGDGGQAAGQVSFLDQGSDGRFRLYATTRVAVRDA
ncbi:serine hydrolase domain-containing protein [Kineosporia succinea]|uniref:CubicO group peptidase (Beta-lactamase class C family) n=1 Tax=Kineosporia succinea TaxID=84632 RepID=A0ABT9PAB7_9ACTN|nr:serine hydrolase domain-containing protein [Kineosporia succinea]MDP9829639.1 CubicO group peptidase (beta-lactamase class C family) [Kineosporia succinea]